MILSMWKWQVWAAWHISNVPREKGFARTQSLFTLRNTQQLQLVPQEPPLEGKHILQPLRFRPPWEASWRQWPPCFWGPSSWQFPGRGSLRRLMCYVGDDFFHETSWLSYFWHSCVGTKFVWGQENCFTFLMILCQNLSQQIMSISIFCHLVLLFKYLLSPLTLCSYCLLSLFSTPSHGGWHDTCHHWQHQYCCLGDEAVCVYGESRTDWHLF